MFFSPKLISEDLIHVEWKNAHQLLQTVHSLAMVIRNSQYQPIHTFHCHFQVLAEVLLQLATTGEVRWFEF